jgi:serine/threonine protein kinase
VVSISCDTQVDKPMVKTMNNEDRSTPADTDSNNSEKVLADETMTRDKPGWGNVSFGTGDSFLGDFHVRGFLGEGGMGSVHLVYWQSADRQFAMKTLKKEYVDNLNSKRQFIQELKTWIDLPDHPHLTACRFFRTSREGLVIFADYIDGGSLRKWVQDARVQSLDTILDVAIQTAWGLWASHQYGVIHQDIKPGNILMTRDGQAKITDFGLARAHVLSLSESRRSSERTSRLVSSEGMTLAYCSPEQASGLKLSHATDMWSWGVSVLEMFAGRVSWQIGTVAATVLDNLINDEQGGTSKVPMHPDVADVLRQCFEKWPRDRWSSIKKAADALIQVYEHVVGDTYPRQQPDLDLTPRDTEIPGYNLTSAAGSWEDPWQWLNNAFQLEDNRDKISVKHLQRSGSRKGQTISDLAVYEEVLDIYERMTGHGRSDLNDDLAKIYHQKSIVHEALSDIPGALAMIDKSIALLENLHEPLSVPQMDLLARAWLTKALILYQIHRIDEGIEYCGKVVDIRTQIMKTDQSPEARNNLSIAWLNKSVGFWHKGDLKAAIVLMDEVIDIRRHLVEQENQTQYSHDLALILVNKASTLLTMTEYNEAVKCYNMAIAIWDRTLQENWQWAQANILADAVMSKAVTVKLLGNISESMVLYDRAIEIRERIVNEGGLDQFRQDLSMAYMNKADAYFAADQYNEAINLYDKVVAIRENLLTQEGLREVRGDIAWTKIHRAAALYNAGSEETACRELQSSLDILKDEIDKTSRQDLKSVLAWVEDNLQEML